MREEAGMETLTPSQMLPDTERCSAEPIISQMFKTHFPIQGYNRKKS